MNDPVKGFQRCDSTREKWLRNRPKCENCGEYIQDNFAYSVPKFGLICEHCMNDFAVYIDEAY